MLCAFKVLHSFLINKHNPKIIISVNFLSITFYDSLPPFHHLQLWQLLRHLRSSWRGGEQLQRRQQLGLDSEIILRHAIEAHRRPITRPRSQYGESAVVDIAKGVKVLAVPPWDPLVFGLGGYVCNPRHEKEAHRVALIL